MIEYLEYLDLIEIRTNITKLVTGIPHYAKSRWKGDLKSIMLDALDDRILRRYLQNPKYKQSPNGGDGR